jgi:hypothetical protein
MPVSPWEAKRQAKEATPTPEVPKVYVINDTAFTPDGQGGIGGVKTFFQGGKHCIRLLDAQAKYWLDQGVIELETPEEAPTP